MTQATLPCAHYFVLGDISGNDVMGVWDKHCGVEKMHEAIGPEYHGGMTITRGFRPKKVRSDYIAMSDDA